MSHFTHRLEVRFRDCDPLGHVNNAAMWSPAEEHLSAEGVVALTGAEIEYRAPIGSEEAVTLHSLYEPGTQPAARPPERARTVVVDLG